LDGGSVHHKALTYKQNKHTSMPQMGFEPMTPMFEWADMSCLRLHGHYQLIAVVPGLKSIGGITDTNKEKQNVIMKKFIVD
jgi:hypothetical protein